jgi:hypothetical protein
VFSKDIQDRQLVRTINSIFQAKLASKDDFPLKHSYILDSGSSLHVSHDLKRFSDFRRAQLGHYAICGNGSVTIQGYGEIEIANPKDQIHILKIHNVAYCLTFPLTLSHCNA